MFNKEEYQKNKLAELKGQLVQNPHLANRLEVFRENYDFFNEILTTFKFNKKLSMIKNNTAYKEIREYLLASGNIKSVEEISDGIIARYINICKEERLNIKVSSKSKKVVKSISDSAIISPPFFVKEHLIAYNNNLVFNPNDIKANTKLLDWSDSSWSYVINEEVLENLTVSDAPSDWSDFWENIYRYFEKKATELRLETWQYSMKQCWNGKLAEYHIELLTRLIGKRKAFVNKEYVFLGQKNVSSNFPNPIKGEAWFEPNPEQLESEYKTFRKTAGEIKNHLRDVKQNEWVEYEEDIFKYLITIKQDRNLDSSGSAWVESVGADFGYIWKLLYGKRKALGLPIPPEKNY